MKRYRNIVGLVVGALAILVGAMLLTGSFNTGARTAQDRERVRAEELAQYWENRISAARSAFRDQVLRHDLEAALVAPNQWADWRVLPKFIDIRYSWPTKVGDLRGLLLITGSAEWHTLWGDTAGASGAGEMLRQDERYDVMVSGAGPNCVVAMVYRLPLPECDAEPASVLALMDGSSVLDGTESIDSPWGLYGDTPTKLLRAFGNDMHRAVSPAVWPKLHAQSSGTVRRPGQPTLVYARVKVPGVAPLLLVRLASGPSVAASTLGLLLAVLGGLAMLYFLRQMRRAVGRAQIRPTNSLTADCILDCLGDAVCVVTAQGKVIQSNRAATELLEPPRQSHATSLVFHCEHGVRTLDEFLAVAMNMSGRGDRPCDIHRGSEPAFHGTVTVRPAPERPGEPDAFVLHFRKDSAAPDVDRSDREAPDQLPDSQSPYPIIYVTQEGLIQLFNKAALRTCPRIKDTPVIGDVLTSLDSRELAGLLENPRGATFESLFGSVPHGFVTVPADEGVLLYAHPMAASQTLEVALRQAQENFNTLSAILPDPVMLVDPRSHTIADANQAATEFFGLESDGLRGRILDSLTKDMIDLTTADHGFRADTPDGAVDCLMHCEMVKIEGIPMLLVMLQREYGGRRIVSPEPLKAAEIRDIAPGMTVLVSLNPVVREVARKLLLRTGHEAETFSSLDSATSWMIGRALRLDLVVVDVSEFPEASDWLAEIRHRSQGVPCLAITDGVTFGLPGDGPNAYLTKPFDLESLTGALSHLGIPVESIETEV